MDSRIDLQQPVLDGGIRSINFFNGRLLSARDLTLEQSAYREADRRVGRALGEGVAYGFEVSKAANYKKDSPAVSVEAGLAINRRGQTLMLDARADIALIRSTTGTASSNGFSECAPLQTGAYVAGAGVYVLTIAPAQTSEGRAMTNGLSQVTSSCNTDTLVSTVQFRLIQIDPPITSAELQDEAHLRNLIAYKCFGVDEAAAFISDPFGNAVKQWGLLDGLRPNQLTDCEVPLAVLYWTDKDGLNFIDMWSVRRRLFGAAADTAWPLVTSERRTCEGEAMFLQFQAQVNDLILLGTDLSTTRAGDIFGYLPPIGLLPISSATSFNYDMFFSEMTARAPIFIEGAQLRPLIREAVHYPPVDTSGEIVVWLYVVRENAQAALASATPPQSYIVFATGHTWYRGEAHYDIHHWNFGNYS
jgi:hypothetical protein